LWHKLKVALFRRTGKKKKKKKLLGEKINAFWFSKTEVTNFNMRFCFHQPTLRVGTYTQVSWAWLQVLPAIDLCGG
jgi:hypothetical protein